MPDDIYSHNEGNAGPDIIKQCPGIVKDLQGMKKKNPRLEYKDEVPHDQEDLAHSITLIAEMERAIIFIGYHPPKVFDKTSLHVYNKNQEKKTEQQKEDLDAF